MKVDFIQPVDVLSFHALTTDFPKNYGLVGKMQLCVVFTRIAQLCLHLFDLYVQLSLMHVEIRRVL